ncbi:MAG: right-handed parallel beta-helix repeat-containing protein, partial [Phycisphaerae bacterium]
FQLINDVTIEGGYAGCGAPDPDERDIELYETILSGDLNGDDEPVPCTQDSPDCDSYGYRCIDGFCIIWQNNSENNYHVVNGSGTDETAILDGLTITAGNDGRAFPDGVGGGVLNVGGSPTVTNCTLKGNSATYGGAMYNISGSAPAVAYCTLSGNAAAEGGAIHNFTNSNPTLTECTFTGNYAWDDGGAIYSDESSPTLTNCTFIGNSTVGRGGAMHNWETSNPVLINCAFNGNWAEWGGGMQSQNASNPTLIDCTFTRNSATGLGGGGGMHNLTASSPTLINCTFMGNLGAARGGGMYNRDYSTPTLTNCVFSGNSSSDFGGGIFNYVFAGPTLTNCTFSGNRADFSGAAMFSESSGSSTIGNCIFWGNSDSGGSDEAAQIDDDGTGTLTVDYTLIQGWTGSLGGTGNIGGDPLFVRNPDDGGDGWGDDPGTPGVDEGATDDYGDLHIPPGSPCIDAADSTAVPADTGDLDNDGDTDEPTPYDLDGMPRFVDDPDTPDTGVPGSPVVDMGAYEYFQDCNRNGLPDICDLNCDALSGTCNLLGCGLSVDVDPVDGVPDECAEFTGGCAPDSDWSCYDNWDIPGDVYPDNTVDDTYSITLDGPEYDVFLDVTVEIDTLQILNGATLNVTQSGVGDLTVVEDGGILANGTIYVGNDRAITVTSGPVTIGAGGVYQADPSSPGTGCDPGVSVCASLSTQSVTIGQGNIAGPPAGTMLLDDAMSVATTGDFVLDGRGAISCEDLPPRGSSDTPPVLRGGGTSTLLVGGNVSLLGSVDVSMDPDTQVLVSGNFNNQSQYPECFECSGGFSLNGEDPQIFEVGGRDLGSTFDGFGTGDDTNFSMGTVETTSDSAVAFVNDYPNTDGAGPCTEALYVHQLVLGAGSQVTLDDCRVYYEELVDNGALVTPVGCGELVALCASDPPLPEVPVVVEKNRYISFIPANTGQQTALRVTLTSSALFPGDVGMQWWVGSPGPVSEAAGSTGSTPPPTFMAAELQSTWHCMDWSTVGLLDVSGCEVHPGATYDVQAIDCTCDPSNAANYSDPLSITASLWGDVVGDCSVTPCTPPNGVVNFDDISSLVDKFRNLAGAPRKARADIAGEPPVGIPDRLVNFVDISYDVDAFRGLPYPFDGPSDCP